jgi:hypothetical protein
MVAVAGFSTLADIPMLITFLWFLALLLLLALLLFLTSLPRLASQLLLVHLKFLLCL